MANFPLSWFKLKHWYSLLQVLPELEEACTTPFKEQEFEQEFEIYHCKCNSVSGSQSIFFIINKNTFPHFGIFGSSLYLHLYLYLYLYLDLYLVRAEARQSGSTLTWQLIYSDQIWQLIFKFSQSFFNKDWFLTCVCICIQNNRGENLYFYLLSKCIFCILTWNENL